MKQDVNYIKHLNCVNQKIFEADISSSDISLYNALFQLWNNCGFDTEISINRNDVMKLSKIGSVNTYLKGLKKLHSLGFINYKPSHNPLKGSIINLFRFDTSSEQVVNKYSTSSDTTTDTTRDTLYKLLNNETIKLINKNYDLINVNLKKWIEQETETKSIKKEKKNKYDFKKSLIDLGVDENIVDDYIIVRKNKRLSNTETAFKKIKDEIIKSKRSANDVISICVEKSWGGFNHKWLDGIIEESNSSIPPFEFDFEKHGGDINLFNKLKKEHEQKYS